jgi:hypothetical protein
MVYPKRENVVFHSGFDNSEEDEEDNKGPGGSYSFRGSKRAAVHRFCKVCGSCVLCDVHADFLAVNVRLPPTLFGFHRLMNAYIGISIMLGPNDP